MVERHRIGGIMRRHSNRFARNVLRACREYLLVGVQEFSFKKNVVINRCRGPREGPTVSVIIPTYERLESLNRAVSSVMRQTYANVEVIVVNDCSRDKRYYDYKPPGSVKVLHLDVNSKSLLGFASAGHVRNIGAAHAQGDWIAFLDDDDEWMPWKLSKQMRLLQKTGYLASCTESYIGHGEFRRGERYALYNAEHYEEFLVNKFHMAGIDLQLASLDTVNFGLLSIHNLIITSTVLVHRTVFEQVGQMPVLPNGQEDYGCWKKVSSKTAFAYEIEPCLYYDNGHAGGRRY